MRPILIAVAVTIAALAASMAVGLQEPPEVPLYAVCEQHGYAASDSGLAQCADALGLECGDPYTDPLRPGCADIHTALRCELIAGQVACWESP